MKNYLHSDWLNCVVISHPGKQIKPNNQGPYKSTFLNPRRVFRTWLYSWKIKVFLLLSKLLHTLNKVYFPLIFFLRRTTAASVTSPSPGNKRSSHSPSSSESIRTNCGEAEKRINFPTRFYERGGEVKTKLCHGVKRLGRDHAFIHLNILLSQSLLVLIILVQYL